MNQILKIISLLFAFIVMLIGFVITIIEWFAIGIAVGLFRNLRNTWLIIWSHYPQVIRQMFKVYDYHGLRHNSKYIETISNKIPFWPPEKQAKFADVFVVRSVKNKSLRYPDMATDHVNYNTYGATAIGNIAYVYLYDSNEDNRYKAGIELGNIYQHYSSLLGRSH